jgi:hypothetical protein
VAMTEAPYSYTLKTPKGGNLLTIRGDGAEDFKANLEQLPARGILTLISQIEATLAGQPAKAAESRPAVAVTASVSTGGQELPSGFGAPKCVECGGETRFDKEGVSQKSGKAYKRFICTASALHKATFTN